MNGMMPMQWLRSMFGGVHHLSQALAIVAFFLLFSSLVPPAEVQRS